MKKVNWILVIVILAGFMFGGFIGSYFANSFLNYGQTFGMSSPVVLDLGFIILTFGLKIQITICSLIGVVIALLIYRVVR